MFASPSPSPPREFPVGIEEMKWRVPMDAHGGFAVLEGCRPLEVTSVFAEKGGVGKTTIAGSVAWELACRGRRVLLVDCDSQCNLSEWLISGFEEFTATEEYRCNNVSTALKYVSEGKQYLVSGCRAIEVTTGEQNARGGGLFIIPGSPDLSYIEFSLLLRSQRG